MGGIKDMLSPPFQNMGVYITPIPPRIYALVFIYPLTSSVSEKNQFP